MIQEITPPLWLQNFSLMLVWFRPQQEDSLVLSLHVLVSFWHVVNSKKIKFLKSFSIHTVK